jgi:hypothetical protein
MVKSAAEVAEKMKERVATGGKYLRKGMDAAEDPLDIISRDPTGYAKKLAAGVTESVRTGAYEAGIKKAKANDSWGKSKERAGRHFEERADDMVTNSMIDYDARAKAIENAQNSVKNLPTVTRDQRIAKSAAYQKAVGAEMDKVYGRKG